MDRLPPLPADARWHQISSAPLTYELSVRGYPVASAERLPDGRWLTRVGLLWADELHREAVAGSARQARRWIQGWLGPQLPRISRARPVTPNLQATQGE